MRIRKYGTMVCVVIIMNLGDMYMKIKEEKEFIPVIMVIGVKFIIM